MVGKIFGSALLVAAALPIPLGPGAARQDGGTAGPPPEPLAVTTGHVERPTEPSRADIAARSHPAGDLILRLPPDDLVAALIESTRVANVTATIERLEAFGTRYVSQDSCRAAGLWIRDRFVEYGYVDVRLDTFRTWTWQDSTEAMNVLACKHGSTRPDEYIVLGGHYDSVTSDNLDDPDAPAPGAEDNGTGVAAVLEAARVLAELETERSIIFACWSAEEEGLWGSRHFVTRAVQESLDIVIYLNMDAIGYLAPPEPDAYMMADSCALALAAWMCDVAREHTGYDFEPTVQPLGASDHNSFWEAGYNVIDSQVDPTSPFMHTPEDVIENLNVDFATAIAAVNVAAAAAAAGVTGCEANLPPETTLVENCAATHTLVTCCPTFEWTGVDFDGSIAAYEYGLGTPRAGRSDDESGAPRRRHVGGTPPGSRRVGPEETSVTFHDLVPGEYTFWVRAIDDQGLPDPSPAQHTFVASDTLAPTLTVTTNFLPAALTFRSRRGREGAADARVFENERLSFTVSGDASSYCGVVDSVSVALDDSTRWEPWEASPYAFVLRPGPADTVLFFKTRDENGSETVGAIRLVPVPAPMDRPLLRVDDWFDGAVPEWLHDAFYEAVFSGESLETWDPLEHIEDGQPTLPPMEELGRYRTVFWTLDKSGGLLRAAQAESSYHVVEGYVRAGGNFIVEGQSALASFGGTDAYSYRPNYDPGDFIYDHVGIDSLRNSGNSTNPSYPNTYGYAFLGGLSVAAPEFTDLAVDTLGKWAEGYALHGGLPWCEVVRPTDETRRLYLFDSYLNPTLQDKPCATMRYARDGTGTFAYFGFPFYYLDTSRAAATIDALLATIDDWQEPAGLLFFVWDAAPKSVSLTWYLEPSDRPIGCNVERKDGPPDSLGTYTRVNGTLVTARPTGRYTFVDTSVRPGSTVTYRLEVIEQWGGSTRHGPWQVYVPAPPPTDGLDHPRPNPTAGTVSVRYTVGADYRWVSVAVYDVAGRLVKRLAESGAQAGEYEAVWDGTNEDGTRVASGVYFVRTRIGTSSFERKVVLLR